MAEAVHIREVVDRVLKRILERAKEEANNRILERKGQNENKDGEGIPAPAAAGC